MYHWLFNNKSIEFSSSSMNDYIIQEGEENFKGIIMLFLGAIILSPCLMLLNSGIFSLEVMIVS